MMQLFCVGTAAQLTTQSSSCAEHDDSQLIGLFSVPVTDTLLVSQVPQHLPSAATQAAEQVSTWIVPPVLAALDPPVLVELELPVLADPPVLAAPPVLAELDPPVLAELCPPVAMPLEPPVSEPCPPVDIESDPPVVSSTEGFNPSSGVLVKALPPPHAKVSNSVYVIGLRNMVTS